MQNFDFHNPTRIAFGQGRIADLAIRENALVAGYHLPGSGIGTLSTRGKGYEFTPLP